MVKRVSLLIKISRETPVVGNVESLIIARRSFVSLSINKRAIMQGLSFFQALTILLKVVLHKKKLGKKYVLNLIP